MKFKCDGKSLAHVLAKVLKVVGRKINGAAAAVLQVIASTAGLLNLVIVGDDVTFTAELPALVDVPGQAFVPPTTVADLVRGMAPLGLPIEFEHDATAQQVHIASGPVGQTVALLPIDVTPQGAADVQERPELLRVPLRRLKQALEHLAPVLAGGGALGAPSEVALDVDGDDRVTLVATDSMRMAMVGVQDVHLSSSGEPRSWNLRLADVRLLAAALIGDGDADKEVVIEAGTRTWRATWGRCTLTAPFSERSFPNWRAIRPRAYTNTLEADVKELGGILRLLSKVGDGKRATVKFRWNGETHATLAAGNREAGTKTDVELGIVWRTRVTPPGSELAISARLLEPLVKRLDTGRLLLNFSTPSQPAMVRPASETEQVEYLVMPINL